MSRSGGGSGGRIGEVFCLEVRVREWELRHLNICGGVGGVRRGGREGVRKGWE